MIESRARARELDNKNRPIQGIVTAHPNGSCSLRLTEDAGFFEGDGAGAGAGAGSGSGASADAPQPMVNQ